MLAIACQGASRFCLATPLPKVPPSPERRAPAWTSRILSPTATHAHGAMGKATRKRQDVSCQFALTLARMLAWPMAHHGPMLGPQRALREAEEPRLRLAMKGPETEISEKAQQAPRPGPRPLEAFDDSEPRIDRKSQRAKRLGFARFPVRSASTASRPRHFGELAAREALAALGEGLATREPRPAERTATPETSHFQRSASSS